MTTEAVENKAEEQTKSKTQELRDWLDREIKRCEKDSGVLAAAIQGVNEIRYGGFTSDERDAKI